MYSFHFLSLTTLALAAVQAWAGGAYSPGYFTNPCFVTQEVANPVRHEFSSLRIVSLL